MKTPRNPDRLIRTYLQEDQAPGQPEVPDHVYTAIRDGIEQTRQRAVIGSMGVPEMSKFLAVGLGAAAVVAVLLIGSNLLGSSSPPPGGAPSESVAPSEAEPSAWVGLAEGPFLITGDDGPLDGGPVQITVDIASSGWSPYPEVDGVGKNDDGGDPPESVGGLLLAWAWPAGTGFNVYGDPCHWSTSIPDTPATTPDEIAAAIAAQQRTVADAAGGGGSDAITPVDVTVGGYAGKAISVIVPMSFHVPGATREEVFAECDQDVYGFYGADVGTEPARNAQGAGQFDELWILDVDGSIVILDAAFSPATPGDLIDEMEAMAESATFE